MSGEDGMNKKRCKALLPLVQLLPAVAAAAAVLFALPRTVPVLAAVPVVSVMTVSGYACFAGAKNDDIPSIQYSTSEN